MPDFIDSSISFPITSISCWVGGVPSGLADLYKHKNFMVIYSCLPRIGFRPGSDWLKSRLYLHIERGDQKSTKVHFFLRMFKPPSRRTRCRNRSNLVTKSALHLSRHPSIAISFCYIFP